MVFDVPAETGGALTILKQYYENALQDKQNEWYFVISTPILLEQENIKILRFPWIKKSWIYRLYFDLFIAHKIVAEYNIDEVLSLQNLIIPNINTKQTLYLHQSLPFVEKRYSIIEDYKLWIYQNVISKMIYYSIKRANKVIVQTKWMKEACLRKVKVDAEKILINKPNLNIKVKKHYYIENNKENLFFYPAGGMKYKNHQIIVEAAKKLREQNILNYRILFTLNGNENKWIKRLYTLVKQLSLPIDFIGKLKLEEVYDYYSKSILLFPSLIETFGLPLLEAKIHGCPIITSDHAFSHEILDDYENALFFNPFNSDELAYHMGMLIKKVSIEKIERV